MSNLVDRDVRHVWHPFTQHSTWPAQPPLVIAGGRGARLVDTDGREYIDGVSSLWVTVHGHREPAIDEAIRAQLDRVAHSTFLGLTHEPGIELAGLLVDSAPGPLTRVFYAGDGSSAVEAALKMAYQAARQRGEHRPTFVHVRHGYHGDTLGAVSVGGIDLFHATYRPILLDTVAVDSPGVRRPGQTPQDRAGEVLTELEDLLARDGHRVSALIVEPLVQAAAGMLTHHPSFLVGVRALCDAHGVLLIADEVATGIGRTGTMWACEQAGVAPDLLTCGKGLSGGYLPIAAVLATEAVFDAFRGEPEHTFFHGHTYTANPLACAASLANLALMEERGTVARAAVVGARMGALLEPLAKEPFVAEVRRAGTMTGIDLAATPGAAARACRIARDRGVLVRPLGDVVVLMPPLGIGDDDLAELVDVVSDCVIDAVAGA